MLLKRNYTNLLSTFEVWTSVPWMTSWSTPVVHVNKYIPTGSNQLIEEYIGRHRYTGSDGLLVVSVYILLWFKFLCLTRFIVQKRNLVELSTLEHVTLTVRISTLFYTDCDVLHRGGELNP